MPKRGMGSKRGARKPQPSSDPPAAIDIDGIDSTGIDRVRRDDDTQLSFGAGAALFEEAGGQPAERKIEYVAARFCRRFAACAGRRFMEFAEDPPHLAALWRIERDADAASR